MSQAGIHVVFLVCGTLTQVSADGIKVSDLHLVSMRSFDWWEKNHEMLSVFEIQLATLGVAPDNYFIGIFF